MKSQLDFVRPINRLDTRYLLAIPFKIKIEKKIEKFFKKKIFFSASPLNL